MGLGGCSLPETFTGVLRDLPYVAITLFTAPESGSFDRVRVDTEHGTFTQSSGHVQGDSVVFLWERDLGSRLLRKRQGFSEFGKTSFTAEFFMSPHEGAPWELVQTAHYRRQ